MSVYTTVVAETFHFTELMLHDHVCFGYGTCKTSCVKSTVLTNQAETGECQSPIALKPYS